MSGGRAFVDEPVGDVGSDRLGRSPYAEQLANVVREVGRQDASTVFALVGPWGSGKSSVLNFVESFLTAELPEGTGGNQLDWAVVRFTPWLCSDLASLVEEFFVALASGLEVDDRESIGKRIGKLAKALTPAAKLLRVAGPDFTAILEPVTTLDAPVTVDRRHRELAEELRRRQLPVLIVLDDLDRLHTDELVLVFKLVRLIGRLPFVHYLMAFDEETILNVLAQSQVVGGSETRATAYLEKIVQVRFDLPPMHESHVLALLNGQLHELQTGHGLAEELEIERLSSHYNWLMWRGFKQPRAIHRFFAHVKGVLPLFRQSSESQFEANPTDLLVLTYLRLYYPILYAGLPGYKVDLVKFPRGVTKQSAETSENRKAWVGILERLGVPKDETQDVLQTLAELFPAFGVAVGITIREMTVKLVEQSRRVGSDEYFDRYFHFGFVGSDIPDTVVRRGTLDILAGDRSTEAATHLQTLIVQRPDVVGRKVLRLLDESEVDLHRGLELVRDLYFYTSPKQDRVGLRRVDLIDVAVNLVSKAPLDQLEAAVQHLPSIWSFVDFYVWLTIALKHTHDDETEISDRAAVLEASVVPATWNVLRDLESRPIELERNPIKLAVNLLGLGVKGEEIRHNFWRALDAESSVWRLDEVLGACVADVFPGETTVGYHSEQPTLERIETVLGIDAVMSKLAELNDVGLSDDSPEASGVDLEARTRFAREILSARAATN